MDKELIKISVRNLVEFILREGDIDNRISRTADKEAMQLGSKMHRKIQRQMGSSYHAEVPLKMVLYEENYDLQVEGRADGIVEEEEITIDEIKGVFRDLEQVEKPITVHLAQAKCYAYIYGRQKKLEKISVQMTYCHLETEEIKRFKENYLLEELEIWFNNLIEEYKKWAEFQIDWKKERNRSIKQIDFPYEYRKGQKELATSVYKTILRRKKLFIQAPTGVGKTMATVFPSVKAVGEGLGEKIFYLTAKTITRTVAEQAFQLLKKQGLHYKVVTLTAKEKICFCEDKECNPERCPYAKGHYDRVNQAVYDMITTTDDMSRENIEIYAKKYEVCPFEMSLDVALWVDAVICDYNYVFDPNAHLRRFFADEVKGEYLFLIDEAHNLVERAREMYSATIYKEEFLEAKRIVKFLDKRLERKLDICNRQLLELKRECETYQVHQSVGHFSISMTNLLMELERFMEECERTDVKEELLEFYFHVRTFLNVYDILDENYTIYTELDEEGNFKLKLFCVNPALNLQNFLDKGNSTIFFSATFLPIHYYKQLLSTEKDNYAIYVNSPFDTKNREILIGSDVSSKYTKRNIQTYEKIAFYIIETLKVKRGNYIAFFPSYQFMENVYEILEQKLTEETTCLLQEKMMTEQKREAFLEEFSKEREGNLLGLCVMGGIFSEGIDLTEEKLVGAFIVGTGLPQICYEREILRQYFEKKNGKGFDYAYLYPGMNKVLQSAGRVIRTETDRGVILLLDERFLQRQCQEIFPREWADVKRCTLESVGGEMKKFWGRSKLEKDTVPN
ncbi:ATP-dependent DNA helicase [Faecalimonas canis]